MPTSILQYDIGIACAQGNLSPPPPGLSQLLSCQTFFLWGISCFLLVGLHSHSQTHFSLSEKRADKTSLISQQNSSCISMNGVLINTLKSHPISLQNWTSWNEVLGVWLPFFKMTISFILTASACHPFQDFTV